MIKCKKCFLLKATEKSKCLCNSLVFNEKKLFKEKPIIQISKKKQKRIKENGSEIKVFKKIAIKRQINGKVICEVCNKKINLESLTHWNFDHKIPKSKGEEFRLNETNIKINCIACHFEKTNGLKLKTNFSN